MKEAQKGDGRNVTVAEKEKKKEVKSKDRLEFLLAYNYVY